MGYSVVSGELKQIGASVTTEGIIEASTLEIGDSTLHDVSYNEKLAGLLKTGERISLLLTPTRYIVALRRESGEIEYACDATQEHLEKPLSIPYYAGLALLGLLTTFAGIGLIILLSTIKSYLKRKDIVQAMTEFRQLAV